MVARTPNRRRPLRVMAALTMVTTAILVVPAGASSDSSAPPPINASASSFDGPEPRHVSPGGCNPGGIGAGGGMDSFLETTRVRVKRGDTGAIIGTFDLPAFTGDFSKGDEIVVLKMEITNNGCDFGGADFVVGIYEDGSGFPGASIATQVVDTSVFMGNGDFIEYTGVGFSYFVGTGEDTDVGDDLLGGGDPAGNQIAIIGVVDVNFGSSAVPHMGECGLSGVLHNSDLDGSGCSTSAILLTVNDPEITVEKFAFIWNKTNPKVFLSGGGFTVNGTFLVDGDAILKPGKRVHYVYRVTNSGSVNDLGTIVVSEDDKCSLTLVESGGFPLGDTNGDTELDVGESWYFLCDRSYTPPLGPSEPFRVITNTGTFEFKDRNGNSTGQVSDDFTLTVGYKCYGRLADIVGTPGADVIVGTDDPDVIVSLGGNDSVDGKNGSDRICLGGGDDEADARKGKDKVKGQGGNDTIRGGQGPDLLEGGGGDDILIGGDGADVILGNAGFDSAEGKGGTDTCVAEVESTCEL